jgi:hypothetical protein
MMQTKQVAAPILDVVVGMLGLAAAMGIDGSRLHR